MAGHRARRAPVRLVQRGSRYRGAVHALVRLAKANLSALRFLVVSGIGFVITMVINHGLKLFVIPRPDRSRRLVGSAKPS